MHCVASMISEILNFILSYIFSSEAANKDKSIVTRLCLGLNGKHKYFYVLISIQNKFT